MASMLANSLVVGALALGLAAQNDTVPSLLNGVEGGTGTAIPFGISGAARVQYIYDAEDLPWSGPRLITRVSLRADNPDGATSFPQKGFLFVSMLLSTTSARAENASTRFEDNYGRDAMVVIDNMPLMLPAQPLWPPSSGPRPANIDFVLTTPWFFGLTPIRDSNGVMPSNLLVEIRVHSQPTGTYRIDNLGNCSMPPVPMGTPPGPLCHSVGLGALALTAGSSMVAGSSFGWTVTNCEPSAPVVLFLGVAPQAFLGGNPALPLPVPLWDAANPTQLPPALGALLPLLRFSAPDCFLEVSPNAMMFGAANASGVCTINVALSPSRSLVGLDVHAQAIAYAQTANPLQVVTSGGLRSTVCGPLGAARIYALGNDAAVTGQWASGQGAVIELH